MAARHQISNFTKNLGKSFGYMVKDTFAEYNPTISSMIKESKDTAEELYSSISGWIDENKGSAEEIDLKRGAKGFATTIFRNLKEDFTSGNFYNKAREEAFANDIMGGDDEIDFGNWDDEDWGDWDSTDDDFDDSESAANIIVSESEKQTKDIKSAMDKVGFSIATAVNEGQVESANYIVQNNRQTSKALYNLNQQGFSNVTKALLGVNDSIIGLAKLGEPITTHINNSTTFFTNTTESLKKIEDSLSKIAENTQKKTAQGSYDGYGNDFTKIFNGDDGLDTGAWLEMVKKNFSMEKDLITTISGFVKKGLNPENIPVGAIVSKWAFQKALPKMFKESMKEFNENLKFTMGNLLLGEGNKLRNKGGILSIIADYLLPDTTPKKTLNTNRYEKGPVAWDGIARHALVKVIPDALMKIYDVLSGRTGDRSMSYDYDAGKWTTVGNTKKLVERNKRDQIRYGAGDFFELAMEEFERRSESGKYKNNRNYRKNDIKAGIENYFADLFNTGDFSKAMGIGSVQTAGMKKDSKRESIEILQAVVQAALASDPRAAKAIRKFPSEMAEIMADYTNEMKRKEANGITNELRLYDNSSITSGDKLALSSGSSWFFDKKDHLGNSAMDYLRGIYANTARGGGKGRRRGGGGPVNMKNIGGSYGGGKYSSPIGPMEPGMGGASREEREALEGRIEEMQLLRDQAVKDRNKIEQGGLLNRGLTYAKDNIEDYFNSNGFTPKSIYQAPFAAAANLLNNLSRSMTSLIWGPTGDPEKGLFSIIFDRAKNAIEEWRESLIGGQVKDKFNKLVDKVFGTKDEDGKRTGGFLSDFYNESRSSFRGAMGFAKDTVKDSFGNLMYGRYSKRINEANERVKSRNERIKELQEELAAAKAREAGIEQAAYGKRVTKTGLVAVSEGELIIPSELNPFYNGVTDKSRQYRNEAAIIDKFYGAFADGGTAERSSAEIEKDLEREMRGSSSAKDTARRLKRHAASHASGLAGIGGAAADTLKSGISSVTAKLFGNGDKDRDIIREKLDSANDIIGEGKGGMGAGALIGAGASILTGAVVGPLAGAAIGSAVGLAVKSRTFQNILFGEWDDEGNRKGGLLSANISNFLNKHGMDMTRGAISGGAAGLLMGSPILGAIVGATAGYVKSSESAREKLFGKEDENGNHIDGVVDKIIPKEVREKMKKRTGGMGLGAAAGLVAGPFGVLPNLLLGAGAGYVLSSEKFHDMMFGDGENEGFLDKLRHRVFDKVNEFFHNVGNRFTNWGKRTLKGLGSKLLGFFVKKLAKPVKDGLISRLSDTMVGKGVRKLGRGIKSIAKLPVTAIESLDNWSQRGNLRAGADIYSADLGRNLTAGERIELSEKLFKKGSREESKYLSSNASSIDALLAGASTPEELKEISKKLEEANYIHSGAYERDSLGIQGDMFKELRKMGFNYRDQKNLKHFMGPNGMDFDSIERALNGASSIQHDDETAKKIKQIIDNARNREKDISEKKNLANKILEEYNLDGDKLDIDAYKKLIESEGSRFGPEYENALKEKELEQFREKVANYSEKSYNVLEKIHSGISAIIKKLIPEYDVDDYLNASEKGAEKDERRAAKNEDYENKLAGKKSRKAMIAKGKEIYSNPAKNEDNYTEFERKCVQAYKDSQIGSKAKNALESAKEKISNFGADVSTEIVESKAEGGTLRGPRSPFSRLAKLIGESVSEAQSKVTTHVDMFGNVHKFTLNNQGEPVEDVRDKSTKEGKRNLEAFKNAVLSVPTAIGGLGGLLGNIKTGLLGDEENDEPGLLGSLMNAFSDVGGITGLLSKFKFGLFDVIAGFGALKLSVDLLNGKFDETFKALGELPIFKGNDTKSGFDDKSTSYVNGKEVLEDENGDPIQNEDGSWKTKDGDEKGPLMQYGNNNKSGPRLIHNAMVTTAKRMAYYGKDKVVKRGIAPGIAHWGGKLIGGVAKRVGKFVKPIGKGAVNTVKNTVKNVKNTVKTAKSAVNFVKNRFGKQAAAEVAEEAAEKAATKKAVEKTAKVIAFDEAKKKLAKKKVTNAIASKVGEEGAKEIVKGSSKFLGILKKFVSNSKVAKLIPAGFKDKLEDISKLLMEKIVTRIAKSGGKGATKATTKTAVEAIPIAGWIVYGAFILTAGIDAFASAADYLGIVNRKPHIWERLIVAIAAMANEAIPVIGGFLPVDVLINILFSIFETVGINIPGSIEEDRAISNQIVTAYNETHEGANYSIAEYNALAEESVNRNFWTSTKARINGAMTTAGKAIAKGAKNAWSAIKNNDSQMYKDQKTQYQNASNYYGSGSGLVPIGFRRNNFGSTDSTDFAVGLLSGGASGFGPDIKSSNFSKFDDKSTVNPENKDIERFANMLYAMQVKSENGDVQGVVSSTFKPSSSFGKIFEGMLNVGRVLYGIKAGFVSISRAFGGESILSKGVDLVKKLFSRDKYNRRDSSYDSGGASGMVSQFDPAYANQKISGKSFAALGCGPAVASMLASDAGKELSVQSAVSMSKPYQNPNGVSMDYFGKTLASKGIKTKMASSQREILSHLSRGGETVLLGRDISNKSKANSPFGPNSHYVLASGMDKKGNIIVKDPESKGARAYSPKILNNLLGGLNAGAGSGLLTIPRRIRRLLSGGATYLRSGSGDDNSIGATIGTRSTTSSFTSGSKNDNTIGGTIGTRGVEITPNPNKYTYKNVGNEVENYLWNYLRNQGFSEAAAAGAIGNFYAETGGTLDSSILQKGGPAQGIAQWEGGRLDDLKDFASANGKDWSDLGVQMDFLMTEAAAQFNAYAKDGYRYYYDNGEWAGWDKEMSLDDFKNLTDVNQAAEIFERVYERAKKPHMDRRYEGAQKYYSMFTGKPLSPVTQFSSTLSSSSASSSSAVYSSSGNIPGSSGLPESSGFAGGQEGQQQGGLLGLLSIFTNALDILKNGISGSDNTAVNTGGYNTAIGTTIPGDNQVNTQSTSLGTNSSGIAGNLSVPTGDLANSFPYFNQGDGQWGSYGYGKGTIKSSGCGPTAMAMVMNSYGLDVTPIDAANYSLENGFRVPEGTGHGFFKSYGEANGLLVSDKYASIEQAKAALAQGIPVIASMKPGDFTTGGHFIVFTGFDGTNVTVNDPGSRERTGKLWGADYALNQSKGFWSITDANGVGSLGGNYSQATSGYKTDDNTIRGAGYLPKFKSADLNTIKGSGMLSNNSKQSTLNNNKYLMDDNTIGSSLRGGSSGIFSYNDFVERHRGTTSGAILAARPGSIDRMNNAITDFNLARNMIPSGGASNLADMLGNIGSNATNGILEARAASNTITADLLVSLVSSITTILGKIASNTAPTAQIYEALSNYNANVQQQQQIPEVDPKKNGGSSQKYFDKEKQFTEASGEVDGNIESLVHTLAQIAKG